MVQTQGKARVDRAWDGVRLEGGAFNASGCAARAWMKNDFGKNVARERDMITPTTHPLSPYTF